jgi:outer membrane protein assembly factor BamB
MEKLGRIPKAALLTLTLTMATLMASMLIVKATEVPEVPTYAFLIVSPNPVGVNQPATVMFWLDSAPPTAAGPAGARWENMTVKITKPDNSVETKGPFRSDPVGGAYFTYTPTTAGTYKFQMFFPGQTIAGVYHKSSQSRIVELTVQQEAIETWPDLPLPTSYWVRPINAELRNWYQIAGNWLMTAYNMIKIAPHQKGGAFNPYTKAPESSHIVWTKELTFGGIAGGELGYGQAYYGGIAYESKLTPPVIISGRLYYDIFPWGGFANVQIPGVVCIDLRTGEEVWHYDNMTQILFGQVFQYDSPNQHGAFAYLWSISTNWEMYDAFTGRLLVTFKNAPTVFYRDIPATIITMPNIAYGPNGEILYYMLNGNNNWLAMWNSTKATPPPLGGAGTFAWMWRPGVVREVDWKNGIQWNVSIPDVPGVQGIGFVDIINGVIVAEAVLPGTPYPTFVHVGYNATTGQQLWIQNRTNFGASVGGAEGRPGLLWYVHAIPHEGVYVTYQKETMQWHAFDVKTGNKLWSTEPLNKFTNTDWSMYDWDGAIAYGKLYVTGYSGCVTAFDLKTGQHLWTFTTGSSWYETPYGTWPSYGGITIADGKLYFANNEHSPTTPYWRGYKLYCLNTTNGELIWSISGFFDGSSLAIADGYLVGYSQYDNRIYCFGKGLTETTVTVQNDVVTKGSSILIKGTVSDLSPAVKGTPCVADEDMSAWMEYLVQQKPMPQNVEGVTVELYAIAEDGTTISIGKATTDPLNGGIFSILWTPPEKGKYTISAVFGGSKSYWESYTSTAIAVTEAPAPSATAEQVQTATQATVEALQPIIIALVVIVVVCICLVAYDIYINRKVLRQTSK